MGKKITIRVSESEFVQLESEAAAAGLTPTEQLATSWRQAAVAADQAKQLAGLEERLSSRIDAVSSKFDGLLSRLRARTQGQGGQHD